MSLACAGLNVYLMKLTLSAFIPDQAGFAYVSFFLLCIMLLAVRMLSEISLTRLTQDNVYKLRVHFAEQIASMAQRSLEIAGPTGIISAIVDDVGSISIVGGMLPSCAMSLCIVVGVLIYLVTISWNVFVLVCIVMVVGTVSYQLVAKTAHPSVALARQAQQDVLSDITMLLGGSKELRLNPEKQEELLRDLRNDAERNRSAGYRAAKLYSFAGNWAGSTYFLLMGLLLMLPASGRFGITRTAAITAFMGVLFMKGALETVIGTLPTLKRAGVAVEHIRQLGLRLERGLDTASIKTKSQNNRFERIILRDISYIYETVEGATPFCIGPVSLEIRRGEIIFLAGGNGAGKTSLLKLLTGLYVPAGGLILKDGKEITPGNLGEYRQLFAAVFQDFFLLKKNRRLAAPQVRECAHAYIAEFGLSGKASIEEAALSFGELSRGQQKRMALLLLLLEESPVYIFDEWAADQDPQFKAYFYMEILPRLKREGKTIVAVTHDDRYYHIADRLIVLREGFLTEDKRHQYAHTD